MKVLILTGGDSSEREISLLSADNVKEALEQNGHHIKLYDLRDGYAPITELAKNFDTLFPVLHGEEGEGGRLHEFLSKLNKPIVGTRNYRGLQKAWYKIPFKKYCDKSGIKTPKWKLVKTEQDIESFGIPCVIKASNGGSSREVAIIKTKRDLQNNEVKKILGLKTLLFVEEYLPGIEITVGILNGRALPIIEIIPPSGEFFSYKNKYSSRTQEIPFAPSIDPKLQKKIQNLTLKIHKHFNLGAYSRTDFMVYEDTPYVVDVNTIPGLTKGSLIPKASYATGMDFGEFLEVLLSSAQ